MDYHESQFLDQLNQENHNKSGNPQSKSSPIPTNSQAYDRYAYGSNNPVRYNDPTGHKNCEEDGYNCSSSITTTITEKALKGDVFAALELLIPTHGGVRGQIEVSGGFGVGLSGTVGVNIIYNRNDNRLEGNIDFSVEPGTGIGAGVSATVGPAIGWSSTNADDATSGYSGLLSGTAAAEGAGSVAIIFPLEGTGFQDISGLHVDPYYGQVPFTAFFGVGAGGAYASAGGGLNGTLYHFDLSNLLR